MNKFIIFTVLMVIACASAKPSILAPAAVAYSSPFVAAAPLPYVAASSSQVVSRNYNGFAVAAPFVTAPAPLIAPAALSPYAAYPGFAASPYAAYPGFAAAPYAYNGLPLAYNAF